MSDFLRRRADTAESNSDFSPEDALRLALADLLEGEIGASGVSVYFVDVGEGSARTYHAYRANLPIHEEILLLETEKDRALDRWRDREGEED